MPRYVSTIVLTSLSFMLGYVMKSNPQMEDRPVKRVTSIGGVFFKARDPQKLKEWYSHHLGLQTDRYGTCFEWRQAGDSSKKGFTQWTPFSEKTKYFEPSTRDFMINYRVENLQWLIAELKKEGVQVLDTVETFDYGQFVHILDLEGNKIELWQPEDAAYGRIVGGLTK